MERLRGVIRGRCGHLFLKVRSHRAYYAAKYAVDLAI